MNRERIMDKHGVMGCPSTPCPTCDDTNTGIELHLTGTDGNAFSIIGKAVRALRNADVGDDQVAAFMDEAQSGTYDHLLQTCMRWFDVA